MKIVPLPVEHGTYLSDGQRKPYLCMGFRVGGVSYISDANRIPAETKLKIEGSRVLILDALRGKRHSSHLSFSEVFSLQLHCGVTNIKRVCAVAESIAGDHILGGI
jgi:phosphoribosyl 1,2-cyclic phosphodiesterase